MAVNERKELLFLQAFHLKVKDALKELEERLSVTYENDESQG
jgi:hypothetical protein